MKDHLLKYLDLNKQFPDKAGKLLQVITTQKRLLKKIAGKRGLDDDIKNLLISVAEGYDVSEDILEWTKTTLQEIATDIDFVIDGARKRNIIEMQSAVIKEYMNQNEKTISQRTSTGAA